MSEFSQIITPDAVPREGQTVRLQPSEAQLSAVAERLELVELVSFTADIDLRWEGAGETLRLAGRLLASVVQRCVVTLQPVASEIDFPFVERFLLQQPDMEEEILVSADEELDLDVIPAEGLDVADIAVQHLSLALDPYPRHPDAEEQADADDEPDVPTGPFAKLAVLKGGKA